MGTDYSIADISPLGWVRNSSAFTERASSSASAAFSCAGAAQPWRSRAANRST
jgi:hypothetical protein